MVCKRCGKEIAKGWRYCPNCGSIIQAPRKSLFDDIFSRFRNEFSEMDKMQNKQFEVLDLSPLFKGGPPKVQGVMRPTRKGFTIKITRSGNRKPKIDVRTFGNVNNDEVRKEVNDEMKSLGISNGGQEFPKPAQRPAEPRSAKPAPEEKPAKVTEEPETTVKREGQKVVVDMKLPDVKAEEDIRISQLESSVEVRARVGDKAYFKIITKPGKLSISSKSFKDGQLHLEFS
jgi:HSP20 family molecular chaperone IbpA